MKNKNFKTTLSKHDKRYLTQKSLTSALLSRYKIYQQNALICNITLKWFLKQNKFLLSLQKKTWIYMIKGFKNVEQYCKGSKN